MNRREPTTSEFLAIAQGIATGLDVIEIAGRIGVDRSTLSGWMRRDGFLHEVASALSSPDDLGADGLAYLRDEELHEGERKNAWALRMEFWKIVEATFPDYFAADEENAVRNREIALADSGCGPSTRTQRSVDRWSMYRRPAWKMAFRSGS